MSSGFVSAGTDQEPIERDDEWRRAQVELEDERRRKAELGRQDGGKSLYEVLQQNKMAKQEAFEEKIKLKNQFRALDDDEIDFLDSIMESTRAQEATVKRETAEQLELFRRQREEAEKTLLEDNAADVVPATEGENWKIPVRKRRRGKELLVPGKKRKSVGEVSTENSTIKQKTSTQPEELTANNPRVRPSEIPGNQASNEKPDSFPSRLPGPAATRVTKPESPGQPPKEHATKPLPSLGLAGYSSDSE